MQNYGTAYTGQYSCFNHCLNKAKGIAKWLIFIDLDEFLFPVKEDNLLKFLKNYENYGAVFAHWVMFGTSGIEKDIA